MFKRGLRVKTLGFLIVICFIFLGFVPEKQAVYAQNQPPSKQSIKGEISAEPKFEYLDDQEILFLPSTSGLYLIEEGQIIQHLYPGKEITFLVLIPDQDFDGNKDLVIGIKDELLPNILCLSSSTGEIIWWFSPENSIYKEGFGWCNYQPEITKTILTSENEKQYLYVAAGYSLYKLSISGGNVIWERPQSYKILSFTKMLDLNGDQSNELCLINQLDEMITVDGRTGEEIWCKKSEFFLKKKKINPTMQNVLFSGQNIWIMYNNGSISTHNPQNGDNIWQAEITLDANNNSTLFEPKYSGDLDGDGYNDVVLSIKGIQQKIVCLSGRNGELRWEYDLRGSAQGSSAVVERDGTKTVFILGQANSKVQYFTFLNLINGQELKEGIVTVEYFGRTSVKEDHVLPDGKGRILITDSPNEIIMFDKEIAKILWTLPKFSDAGFLEYKNNEYLLLYSLNQKSQEEEKIGLIQKVSAEKDIAWEYLLESSLAINYRGMEKIQICDDLDGDGMNDILAALSPDGTVETNLPSKVIALSGKTGNVLWQRDLILNNKINSLIQFQDVNNDGSPEVLVGTSSYFYILDGLSGKILKNWTHFNLNKKTYFEPTKGLTQEVILIPAGDVNKDGLSDIFVVAPQEVRLGLTNRVGGLDFYFKELYRVAQGEFDLNRVHMFDDLDQDGISELFIRRNLGNQKTIYTIISGSDGELRIEEEGSNVVLKAANIDFNNNGSLDVISYQDNEDQGRQFKVIDGVTGNVVWSYQGFSGDKVFNIEDDLVPGCVIEDLNSDGIPELAIIKNTDTGTGMMIEIFDVAGGWEQPLKTLNIQDLADGGLNQRWTAGLTIQKVIKNTKQYLAVVGRLGGRDEGGKLILYDYLEEKPVAFYPILTRKVNLNSNSLIVEDLKGKVRLIDFPVDNPTVVISDETSSSPIKIKWQNREPFVRTKIYVDNVLALETTNEVAELEITEGEHTIGVAQYSLSGRYSLQIIPVKIVGSWTVRTIIILLTIASLGLVFGIPYYFGMRIKAGVRNG